MEETGGEPDVVGYNPKTNEYFFVGAETYYTAKDFRELIKI